MRNISLVGIARDHHARRLCPQQLHHFPVVKGSFILTVQKGCRPSEHVGLVGVALQPVAEDVSARSGALFLKFLGFRIVGSDFDSLWLPFRDDCLRERPVEGLWIACALRDREIETENKENAKTRGEISEIS